MVEFLFVIILIVVCVLLFGKADSKKYVLNQVGLDLSKKSYENKKENEFAKYCVKAMLEAVSGHNVVGKNEMDFLYNLDNILDFACRGLKYYHDYDAPKPNLYVKSHYIKFASTVVNRRIEALKKGDTSILIPNCNYAKKQDLKKYINKLWDKYQYPWSEDWLKEDSFL